MKGHQSEEIAARYLEDLGWNVSVPRDRNAPYDLLVETLFAGMRLVEVKPGRLKGGRLKNAHNGSDWLTPQHRQSGYARESQDKNTESMFTSLCRKRADWLALVDKDGSVVILNLHQLLAEKELEEFLLEASQYSVESRVRLQDPGLDVATVMY